MDVKALYPSMSWVEIVKSVKWLIVNSDMCVENVNWFEVGKYLAVMMTPEEINEEGLEMVIPKRRGVRLRKITVNYLRHKINAAWCQTEAENAGTGSGLGHENCLVLPHI